MTHKSLNELKCLKFLVKHYDEYEGGTFFGFSPIAKHTRLSRRKVRIACRSLARKGLAQYAKGLSNHDGEFGGSGYSATSKAIQNMRKAIGGEG